MSKLRVYLSKSKAGKTEDLNKVLSLLKDYDIEIVTWDGSKPFNAKKHEQLIKSCDLLLLLPPKFPKAFSYDFNIGKGQSVEVSIGMEINKGIIYTIICIGDELYVSKDIEENELIKENWPTDYEWLEFTNDMKPFHEWDERIKFKPKAEIIKAIEYKSIKPMLACINLIK